jgi:AcrR family transcriptional regulator
MSRKENILEAATELFAKQGFNGTATSEIARKAGVAQGTVFHHFKSKENLLISICDELVTEYVKGIREAALGPGTGWDALERVLKFSLDFLTDRTESITVAFRETRVLQHEAGELKDHFSNLMNQIIDVKRDCIERGQADGSIRQVDPHKTAFLLYILIKGIHHTQAHGLLQVPDLSSEVVEFCSQSLATGN